MDRQYYTAIYLLFFWAVLLVQLSIIDVIYVANRVLDIVFCLESVKATYIYNLAYYVFSNIYWTIVSNLKFGSWWITFRSTEFFPRNVAVLILIFVFPQSVGHTIAVLLLEECFNFFLRQLPIFVGIDFLK